MLARCGRQVGGIEFEDTNKLSVVPNFAPFRQKSLGDCTRPLFPTQGLEHRPHQKRPRTQTPRRVRCPPGSVCAKSVENLRGCPSIKECTHPLVSGRFRGSFNLLASRTLVQILPKPNNSDRGGWGRRCSHIHFFAAVAARPKSRRMNLSRIQYPKHENSINMKPSAFGRLNYIPTLTPGLAKLLRLILL
jgi:hypothetical protein